MKILAHRGFWKTEDEKNSLTAFKRAFEHGYGIETDIRDLNGRVVISHNPANVDCPTFEDMLDIWAEFGRQTLALNVKSDGLYLLFGNLFGKYGLDEQNSFLFDSSVPEQVIYLKRGYNIFARCSEFEEKIAFFDRCKGVWLDQFTVCEHIKTVLPGLLESGKTVSVVSPELHGREYEPMWTFLKQYKDYPNFILCTDIPDKAEEFFK